MKTKRRKKTTQSSTKVVLAKHFEEAVRGVRSLLGQETEKGMNELYEHYLPALEKVGAMAREKAISDAVSTIKRGSVEVVMKIMELRKAAPRRAIRKKVITAIKPEHSGSSIEGKDHGHES